MLRFLCKSHVASAGDPQVNDERAISECTRMPLRLLPVPAAAAAGACRWQDATTLTLIAIAIAMYMTNF